MNSIIGKAKVEWICYVSNNPKLIFLFFIKYEFTLIKVFNTCFRSQIITVILRHILKSTIMNHF
jgi:hypothetical protein